MEKLPKLRFVIASSGRAGSGWISRVLTACGLPCGHESIFNIDGVRPPRGLWGDSSWLATPFLEYLPKETVIVHQLRHPLSVINSFRKTKFLYPENPSRYAQMRYNLVPDLSRTCQTTAAMQTWLWFNETIESIVAKRSWVFWRVEDVKPRDIEWLCDALGVAYNEADAVDAIENIDRQFTSHTHVRVGWKDLPKGTLKTKIKEKAEQWGYEIDG